jgi:hypothetical protein
LKETLLDSWLTSETKSLLRSLPETGRQGLLSVLHAEQIVKTGTGRQYQSRFIPFLGIV